MMSKYKNIILMIIVVGIIIVILAGIWKFDFTNDDIHIKTNDGKIVQYDKLIKNINSFKSCENGGFEITESIPRKCSTPDGKVYIEVLNNQKKDESDKTSLVPKFYKKLKVIEEKEIEVEISRSLKECFGIRLQKCMQVKPKGEEWQLYYDKIYGFDYQEGDYYILKVRETKYDFSSNPSIIPAGAGSTTWELVKILKHVKPEKSKKYMNINIPKLNFSEEENGFIIKFTEYQVPKSDMVLTSVLKKLFQLRSNGDSGVWNGLSFDRVDINNNTARIKLTGAWYPDGDMSSMYMRKEIQAAIFQFETVTTYGVTLNGKSFDWCIDDMSDGEGSCPENPQLWEGEKE